MYTHTKIQKNESAGIWLTYNDLQMKEKVTTNYNTPFCDHFL